MLSSVPTTCSLKQKCTYRPTPTLRPDRLKLDVPFGEILKLANAWQSSVNQESVICVSILFQYICLSKVVSYKKNKSAVYNNSNN